jgi:hypothetical protein
VEQTAVGTSADLIDDVGLEIAVDGSRDIFSLASLGKEGAESLIRVCGFTFFGQVSIRLNTMLEAVKLPARVCNLATGLADVDRDNFSHIEVVVGVE